MSKIVTLRSFGGKFILEDGFSPYPKGNFNFKSYNVPKTLDLAAEQDVSQVAALYMLGQSSNEDGTITVVSGKAFYKKL